MRKCFADRGQGRAIQGDNSDVGEDGDGNEEEKEGSGRMLPRRVLKSGRRSSSGVAVDADIEVAWEGDDTRICLEAAVAVGIPKATLHRFAT